MGKEKGIASFDNHQYGTDAPMLDPKQLEDYLGCSHNIDGLKMAIM